MHSKFKRWIISAGIFISILITLGILGDLFPYTGLAYIVVVPIQLIVVITILMLSIWLTAYLSKPWFFLCWIAASLICIFLIISTYPQEFRPSVPKQIAYSIGAILNYDNIPESDLYLPFAADNYSSNLCAIKNSQERHLVAMYKYRHIVVRDSAFRVSKYTDRPVQSEEDIFKQLETGQERLMWGYLSYIRK